MALGYNVAVVSFSSQFLVLLSSLKLNECHRHFLTHTRKHSFQIETFKASKTWARDKLFLASVLRDKDFFSHHSFVQWPFEDERCEYLFYFTIDELKEWHTCISLRTRNNILSISTRSRPQKHYVFGVGFKKQRLFLAPSVCTRDDCLKIKKL